MKDNFQQLHECLFSAFSNLHNLLSVVAPWQKIPIIQGQSAF
jgi:hypothetical protein